MTARRASPARPKAHARAGGGGKAKATRSRLSPKARTLWREQVRRKASRRAKRQERRHRLPELLATRFDRQRAVITSRARKVAVKCTRRAGKTEALPALLYRAAEEHPESVVYYVAITGKRARELMWGRLTRANRDYRLGYTANKTLATLYHPTNGTEIRLTGADNLSELEKRRGDKTSLVVVDEAQSYPSVILSTLVEDIFWPSLLDVKGQIVLVGTPGLVCHGYWYGLTGDDSPEALARRNEEWTVYEWSALENPHVAVNFREELERRLQKYGPTEPTTLREYQGRWVNDRGALFYAYHETRNVYGGRLPAGHAWYYVVGCDLGFDDAFALVVIAFSLTHPTVYEVESFKKSGLTAGQWAARIQDAVEEWNPVSVKVDRAGAVKGTVEEWRTKYNLPVEAADKDAKPVYVGHLNSEMLAARVKLLQDGPVAQEMSVLPKDPDGPKDKPPREHPSFPNHAADAFLYAWREAWRLMGDADTPTPEAPVRGSPEWYDERARQAEARSTQRVERMNREEKWGT